MKYKGKTIFTLGVKENMPESQKRTIKLSNQISLLFSVVILALILLTSLKLHAYNTAALFGGVFFVLIIIPFLNKIGAIKFTGFLISLIVPIAIVGATVFAKINVTGDLDFSLFIAPRILLIGTLILPLVLIDYRNTGLFVSSLIVHLIAIASFSELHNYLGIGVDRAVLNPSTYPVTIVVSVFSMLTLVLSILFFQKLNVKYEKDILQKNVYLDKQKAELQQQQEATEKLNQEIFAKSLETEQAKSEIEKYNAELILQQEATEKLNQEIFAKSLETEQAKLEIERFNKELILHQEATEKLSQEIFAKSLETEQAKLELEKTTEKIRTQAVIAEILTNISGKQRNIENFLQNALEKILNVSWLDVMSKGSIFLTDEDGNLKMVAEKDLGEVAQRCALIKPGECLCGRALSEKKIQFCDHISDKHEIKFDNMSEHGHYNLPIMMEDEVLGVLNIYTSHQHQKKDFEIEFLETVAHTLASVIHRKKSQDEILRTRDELNKQKEDLEKKNKAIRKYMVQIEQQTHERESLNQLILAQKKNVEKRKEEVEQRNAEIEKYSKELEEQAKEQEKLNQQLFAQKMEVEQRNMEVEQYSKELEDKAKEQERLNQQLFAQKMEVEQRNFEVEQYSHEVEELKEKAEGTLKHLNDSINYSKYIQDSLLPEKEYMDEVIPGDYFIYYKPKETIGGDFYYVKKVNDYIIFAVADCTGHGVPGALITMLGLTFLDDIITGNIVSRTGMGLTVLREKFKNTFKAYGDNITNKNGLDIGLCAINTKTNMLQFSGAFNTLFVYRNNELIELKGTRNPIGYYPVEKEFETQELQLEKDDMIYLFSDGYPDQLGGEKGRKFSKRQFRGLLTEIHSLPISQQKLYVEKIMEKWMGNVVQVDDITLMGVKWGL